MRIACAVAALLFLAACSQQEPTSQASLVPQPPKWMKEEKKKVEPSAAVKALAENDDPDLKAKLTPEQVKATLAAAQAQQPVRSADAGLSGLKPTGEWNSMEKQQNKANAEYEKALDQIVAIIDGDSRYHSQGCPLLYVTVAAIGGALPTKQYAGTGTTVRAAKARGMTPHLDCNAPNPKFTYQQQ